jgi:sec-independent protein translocase protein TatA
MIRPASRCVKANVTHMPGTLTRGHSKLVLGAINAMGLDNPLHIAFLLVILLLVFGAKRLPELGRSLGSGMRGFKESLTGGEPPAASNHTLSALPAPADAEAQPQPLSAVPGPGGDTQPHQPPPAGPGARAA